MAPWLQRRGWKPSGKAAPTPRTRSLLFGSSGASDISDPSSDPSKKLTVEGAEGPSVSADSDRSGVSVVSLLFLRPRSCSFRLLRESVPSGPSGWVRAASDTLRRIGSVRGAKVRGPVRPAAKPGSVGRVCGWLAGKAALGAEAGGGLYPRAVEAQTPGCPRLQFQGGGGRSPLSWRWGSVLMEGCV